MNGVVEFLNQPIILTLVTLIVGSFLLSLVAERRARKEKLRDKAIEFLTEAGNNINHFVPIIYAQLRTGNLMSDQSLADGLKDLYTTRMSVQVGSEAYLRSMSFYQQYFQILDQLTGVVTCITQLDQGEEEQKIVAKIQKSRLQFADAWPGASDPLRNFEGRPIDELIAWMDMIMQRTTHLLSSHLQSVVK